VALGEPKIVGTPFALSAFVGLAALALAAVGLRARRTAALLGAAALVLAWLAAGDHLGADRLLSILPLVRSFRYTEKYLGPLTLCLALLAALGLERASSDARSARRLATGAGLAAGMAALVTLALSAGGSGLIERVPAGDLVASHLRTGLTHAVVAGFALAASALALARDRRTLGLAAALLVVWGAGAAAAPYALRPGQPDARTRAAPPRLAAEPPGPRLLQLRHPAPRPPGPGLDAIDQLSLDASSFGIPNTNVPFRVDVVQSWTGLRPRRFVAVEDAVGPGGEAWWAVARRFAATHAIFPPPSTPAGRAAAARATAGGVRLDPEPRTGAELWALPHRPWASFPPEVLVAGSDREALAALVRLEREGSSAAVVESREPLPAAPGRVLAASRELERLRIEAEALADATLVVNDAFWPGWRATVDGEEVPILAADVLVRAVRFPAGRHTVEMAYSPPELVTGGWTSLAGALALGGATLTLRRRRGGAR
jgi:hypothetical protein